METWSIVTIVFGIVIIVLAAILGVLYYKKICIALGGCVLNIAIKCPEMLSIFRNSCCTRMSSTCSKLFRDVTRRGNTGEKNTPRIVIEASTLPFDGPYQEDVMPDNTDVERRTGARTKNTQTKRVSQTEKNKISVQMENQPLCRAISNIGHQVCGDSKYNSVQRMSYHPLSTQDIGLKESGFHKDNRRSMIGTSDWRNSRASIPGYAVNQKPNGPCSPSNIIQRENLEAYLNRANDVHLEEEFSKMPKGYKKSMIAYNHPDNLRKNRYTNNFVYDDTRVILKSDEKTTAQKTSTSDYINASYVRNYKRPYTYIATQGPKDFNENTMTDFWRMIWHENVNMIVMIACLVESGKVKVAPYWPTKLDEKMTHGRMTVKLLSEAHKLDYCLRTLSITFNNETREVMQYQFTAWPDHGVPHTPFSFACMVKDIRNIDTREPIVVHCSAGIGRTGTLLLVLTFLDQLDVNGYIDAPVALSVLRMSRPRLVENKDQYIFSHQVLNEILFGQQTAYDTKTFLDYSGNWKVHREELQNQYERLKKSCSAVTYRWGSDPKHVTMNRNPDIVPVDGRQIFLQVGFGVPEPQYINAVEVCSLTQRNAVIVTEHPLQNTLSKAWRLMYEKKVLSWVILNQFQEFQRAYPQISPNHGETIKFEHLLVQCTNFKIHQGFTEKKVTVTLNRSKACPPHTLSIFQLNDWYHGQETPVRTDSFINLMSHLQSIRNPSSKDPIVFTCSDGVTASGIAVATDMILSRFGVQEVIDVYKSVRCILDDRPQFIVSMTQYLFLHKVAATWVKRKTQQRRYKDHETKKEFLVDVG